MTKTKVLCTIGPASDSSKTIGKMVEAGMNAVRINTSHGTLGEYKSTIKRVRKIANIPVHLDTSGPQIRLVSKKKLELKKGSVFSVGFSRKKDLYFSRAFFREIEPGKHILLSDGLAELVVLKKDPGKREITLQTMNSIILHGNMHANIPSIYLDIPILCKKDRKVIALAKRMDADFINLSFTRRKGDVLAARKMLRGSDVGIIAKIENREALQNIAGILEEADGIMVARGDLGLEIPSEQVPLVQKEIVRKCGQAGKPAIIATQMLASMVNNRRPTRAETSDVANAILDGADCVMLSNETAVGLYPTEAVKEMKRIAIQTEPYVRGRVNKKALTGISDVVSKSIHSMSLHLPISRIIAITNSGFTARMISRFKPSQEIIAVTNNAAVERKLRISYGITPVLLNKIPEKKKISRVAGELYRKKLLKRHDLVIFTAGIYQRDEPTSNAIQIHRVSDLLHFAKKS